MVMNLSIKDKNKLVRFQRGEHIYFLMYNTFNLSAEAQGALVDAFSKNEILQFIYHSYCSAKGEADCYRNSIYQSFDDDDIIRHDIIKDNYNRIIKRDMIEANDYLLKHYHIDMFADKVFSKFYKEVVEYFEALDFDNYVVTFKFSKKYHFLYD